MKRLPEWKNKMKEKLLLLLVLTHTPVFGDYVPSNEVQTRAALEREVARRIESNDQDKRVSVDLIGGEEFSKVVTLSSDGDGYMVEVAVCHQRIRDFGELASRQVILTRFPSEIEGGGPELAYSFVLDANDVINHYKTDKPAVSMLSFGMETVDGDRLLWVMNYLVFSFSDSENAVSFVGRLMPLLTKAKDVENKIQVSFSR